MSALPGAQITVSKCLGLSKMPPRHQKKWKNKQISTWNLAYRKADAFCHLQKSHGTSSGALLQWKRLSFDTEVTVLLTQSCTVSIENVCLVTVVAQRFKLALILNREYGKVILMNEWTRGPFKCITYDLCAQRTTVEVCPARHNADHQKWCESHFFRLHHYQNSTLATFFFIIINYNTSEKSWMTSRVSIIPQIASSKPDILIECMSNLWGWSLPLRAWSMELNNWWTFVGPGWSVEEEAIWRDELPTPPLPHPWLWKILSLCFRSASDNN